MEGRTVKEKLQNKTFRLGLNLFLGGSGVLLFYFFIKDFGKVMAGLKALNGILFPFILGAVLAYLLCPIYNVTVRFFYRHAQKWNVLGFSRIKRRALTFSRVIGSIVALIVLFAVMAAAIALIVPQLIKSVVAIVKILPGRIDDLTNGIAYLARKSGHSEVIGSMDTLIHKAIDSLMTFAAKKLIPGTGSIAVRLTEGIVATAKLCLNILVAVIVSVYLLNGKEKLKANMKRFILSHFSRAHSEEIMNFGSFCNRTFGGFINGKIIDSIIIGILCYILMVILHLPYTALISTIVGVTNIIPFFGPFIGAIPSAILICVISPLKALYFLIMILGLQQFDGNILGPKILGDSTGLASFWVMFAIIVGGGLFGVAGMVLGVPTFAIITYYFDRNTGKRLRSRGFKEKTDEYIDFNVYDADRKDILK
jgi:predicted PurR-regulated permease PerM